MTIDKISKVDVDARGCLRIFPATERFPYIYRAAAEVSWDDHGGYLYSPVPRQWTYARWFAHIVDAVASEYGCMLTIDANTDLASLDATERVQIISAQT